MTFLIRFTYQPAGVHGVFAGELVLNDRTEEFLAAVDPGSQWSKADYQKQWRDGLKRIVDGKRKSCLVISLPYREFADLFVFWSIHRIEGHVVFRMHVRSPDQLPRNFDPAKPYRIVPRRETVDRPRRTTAEYRIGISEIIAFYHLMELGDAAIDAHADKPAYFYPEEHTPAELEAIFKSGDGYRIYEAFLNAAYFNDADWVQTICIDALNSPVVKVRVGAIDALQILAAVRKELEPSVVIPAILPLRDDPDSYVRDQANAVLQDIRAVFGQ